MNESGKVAFRSYHDWILPKKILLGILIFSCVFLFIGVILLAVGGGSGISSVGAVLAGLGGCGFTILLLLCLHAYFVFYVNDESTQTWENITSDMTVDSSEFPSYAVVQKPSSLKDGSLKKNGKLIAKKVTLPPDIDIGNGNRSPAINTVAPSIQQQNVPQQYEYPTYTEVRKYPQGYGSQPSPHSPIYPQQAPYVQSSPGGYGQPFPAQYPRQVYATQRKEPDYPPNYLQHPLPQSRMGYDDDYDNTVESTPMINQPINAKNLCYKSESDLPEPQPLVYPSAKRPMVFEQTSSSKMSIYDNVELFSSKNKD